MPPVALQHFCKTKSSPLANVYLTTKEMLQEHFLEEKFWWMGNNANSIECGRP